MMVTGTAVAPSATSCAARRFDFGQRAGHAQRDLRRAAGIAETVDGAHGQRVAAGLQVHADVFPGHDLVFFQAALLADLRGRHRLAVDREFKACAQRALDADPGLRHRQQLLVHQADKSGFCVQVRQQVFQGLQRLFGRGGLGGGRRGLRGQSAWPACKWAGQARIRRGGAAGVAHGAQVPRSARQGRHGVAAGVVLLRAGQAHGTGGGQRAAVGRDGAAVGLQQRAGSLGDFRGVAQRLAARRDLLRGYRACTRRWRSRPCAARR
jgi:hypothetical protein